MTKKPKKQQLIMISLAIVILVGAPVAYFVHRHKQQCIEIYPGLKGHCLKKGYCTAPNDGEVPCNELNSDGSFKSGFGL